MRTTLLIGVMLGVFRIYMVGNVDPEPFQWIQAYKDAAHLFMGGLAVAWWYGRMRWQWWLFWILNIVEVTCAVLSRWA